MDPFLTVEDFEGRFRGLAAEEAVLAPDYLRKVSDWIRDQKPDIAQDDPGAILVTFEVTREALQWGKYWGLSTFGETVGPRSKTGTLLEVEKFITSRHRNMLGLSIAPRPVYYFGD